MCIWGVMITIIENGHDNPSSNPEQGSLHFTAMGK